MVKPEDINATVYDVHVIGDAPSSPQEIQALLDGIPKQTTVPDDYLELIRVSPPLETLFDYKEDDTGIIRTWSAKSCLYYNQDLYRVPERFGGLGLAIGDNTGGGILVHINEAKNSSRPGGLYVVDGAIVHIDYCNFVANSLTELLVDGVGAENTVELPFKPVDEVD